jgi:hypothetical protein
LKKTITKEEYLDLKYENARKKYVSPITKNTPNKKMKSTLDVILNSSKHFHNRAKALLSDEFYEFIESYNELDLNFLDIVIIMNVKNKIDDFVVKQHSANATAFNREVEQLKKDADKLVKYTDETIIVSLPFRASVSLSMLVHYFELIKADKDTMDIIIKHFFNTTKPRTDNKTAKFLINTCTKISDKILSDEKAISIENIEDEIKGKTIDKLIHVARNK